MAIYHFSASIISRGAGKSSVASVAYRAGEKLTDERQGLTFDYTHKQHIEFSNIVLPENAPQEFQDRSTLWNSVENIEKTKDAQLAREFTCAIPHELTKEQGQKMVQDFAESLAREGMCVDYSIHDNENNRHAHIMATMRPLKENGEWGAKQRKAYKLDEQGEKIPLIDKKTGEQKIEKKTGRKVFERETVETVDWNQKEKLVEWRDRWASVCNQALEQASSQERVTPLSHKAMGRNTLPTIHEGYVARQIEQKGGIADRCQINRDIKEYNRVITLETYYAERREELNERRELERAISSGERTDGEIAKASGELARAIQETTKTDRAIESTDRAITEPGQSIGVADIAIASAEVGERIDGKVAEIRNEYKSGYERQTAEIRTRFDDRATEIRQRFNKSIGRIRSRIEQLRETLEERIETKKQIKEQAPERGSFMATMNKFHQIEAEKQAERESAEKKEIEKSAGMKAYERAEEARKAQTESAERPTAQEQPAWKANFEKVKKQAEENRTEPLQSEETTHHTTHHRRRR